MSDVEAREGCYRALEDSEARISTPLTSCEKNPSSRMVALPDTIGPIRRAFEQLEIVGDAHAAGCSRADDDGERTEDGVDGAALEAELAQVGAGEQRVGVLEQLGRRQATSSEKSSYACWSSLERGSDISEEVRGAVARGRPAS